VTQPDELHRRQRLSILAATEAALADPVRLIGILRESEDDDAARRLPHAFDLDDLPARAVMDLQVRRVTAANRARIAEELRVLRTDWGPTVEAHVRISG
jgi:DNA gyrase/topoisomerase IV subunit A